jgi:ATP-binding cassette subfamily F protein 3
VSLIQLAHISKSYGAEPVLEDVSFRLERGDHAALVGSNGAGKSTLLRLIAGLEEPDGGHVTRARDVKLSYLAQEPDFDEDATLFETMLAPFAGAIEAEERLAILQHELSVEDQNEAWLEEYGRLQARVEHAGYAYRESIERALEGLDLPRELWEAPISTLSGGQRTRANLAQTLLQDADVLLLDEPTNHLDIPAVEWLEGHLRELKQAFLIVAHDRYLLDRVSTRTIEISQHRATSYPAEYSRFLELRAERLERQKLEYESQQEHIAKTEEFIRRYGAGQRYKEARGRQKRLDRLERVERPQNEQSLNLKLSRPNRTGDLVLEAKDLVAGYPGNALVRLAETVVVERGDRVAIVGPNGSGKTTLLRTMIGELRPLGGSIRWGSQVSKAYYSQSLGDLDPGKTVIEEIQATRSMSEEEARTLLGSFLFYGDDVFKTVDVLSGGETSRVALAKLVLEAPNVLVLDEPTNHLDIAARDALEKVLSTFQGTLLFVSHDRYLIDALARQLWVVDERRVRRFAGGYSGYAAGTAQALDYVKGPGKAKQRLAASPLERVLALEEQAGRLSARLAEVAPSAPTTQLSELIRTYGETVEQIDQADWQWLQSVRKRVPTSSA